MKTRGFTLVELLIAVAVTAILATALTRILLSDSRFVSRQEALITARQTARAAMNVLSVELRMVSDSGLLAAAPESVLVRMPYAFGMACQTSGGARIASLMPTDSLMYYSAAPSGIARREINGEYSFISGITVNSSIDTTACTTDSVRVVPQGMLVAITPDTVVASTRVFYLYQTVAYRFMASVDLPGRVGLWRRAGTGSYEELAAPFDTTARFRFLVGPDLQVQDAPPMNLNTVGGLELMLVAESYEPPRGTSEYQEFELPIQVVFLNRVFQ